MRTSRLAITSLTITLGALAFSSCSKIAMYRKDPSLWNRPAAPQAATSPDTSSSQTLAGQTPPPAISVTQVRQQSATASPTNPHVKKPRHTHADSAHSTLPVLPTTEQHPGSRRVSGLRTPNANKLPTQKDLQEVQAPTTKKKSGSGIKIPTQP